MCAHVYECWHALQVGFFGYVAFYDHEIVGDVLMNFRPTLFSEIMKLGFVVSTVISFPLVIFPCRASIYTLLCTQVNHRTVSKLCDEFFDNVCDDVCLQCFNTVGWAAGRASGL